MKKEYLNDLKELLDQYNIEEVEKNDLLDEYSDMYDGWIENGMNTIEVEEKLGKPDDIIDELMEGYSYKAIRVVKNKDPKIIALMPFISLIIFFILGFGYDLWHPGWMAFLLIPMVAVLHTFVEKRDRNILIGLTPFIASITYMVLGFYFDLWHPGWLVFLLIPISSITISNKRNNKKIVYRMNLVALSPFISLIGFFILGELGYYDIAWLIFLLIPMIGIWYDKNVKQKVLYELVFIIGIVGYLYLYSEGYDFLYSVLAFAPLALLLLCRLLVEYKDLSLGYKVTFVLSIALFLFLGLQYSLWGYAWLVFLSIPSYAIIVEVKNDDKYMALMPFIALTIFFTLGYFFDLWAISWIAFLLIPMYAIIKGS